MESVSLYSEARNEYLKQLSTWVVPPLVEFFRKEYNSISAKEGSKRAMSAFQEFCSTVPRWNQDVIDTNIGTLLDNCRCDYVEELMTAVFIAHTKMLTAIRVSPRQKKLQITLPKLDHFLHRVFTECARSFWKAPFLFADELTPIEKQKNVLQAEAMCTESLSGAVRSLLPVKNILRDYLNDEEEDEEDTKAKKTDEDDTDIAESVAEPTVAPVAVGSAETAVGPVEQAVASAETAVVPAEPAVAPVEPAVVPAEPAVAPAEPAVAPAEPAVAPAEPAVAPVEPAVVPTESVVAPVVANQLSPVTIEKLDTPPIPGVPTPSPHAVENVLLKPSIVNLEKNYESTPEVTQQLRIDTEPSVHFTPYDTVYDETSKNISEIRYTPKDGDNWDNESYVPKLSIGGNSTTIGSDDVEELEPRAVTPVQDVDVDVDLSSTADFEVLA